MENMIAEQVVETLVENVAEEIIPAVVEETAPSFMEKFVKGLIKTGKTGAIVGGSLWIAYEGGKLIYCKITKKNPKDVGIRAAIRNRKEAKAAKKAEEIESQGEKVLTEDVPPIEE